MDKERISAMSKIILASGSPRRKELLEQVNLTFEVRTSSCEEKITKTIPQEVVMELSCQKASDVAASLLDTEKEDCYVIGADTIVASQDLILGKPADEEEAFSMLEKLSGSCHQVCTGVTLIHYSHGKSNIKTFYEKTDVYFYPLTSEKIHAYLTTGEPQNKTPGRHWNTHNGNQPEWYDKAGAYGIQGYAAAFVQKIDGDYNNVVGLPVARLLQEMENF